MKKYIVTATEAKSGEKVTFSFNEIENAEAMKTNLLRNGFIQVRITPSV